MPITHKSKNTDKSFFYLQEDMYNNEDAWKRSPISLNMARYEFKHISERKGLPANKEWSSSEYSYNKSRQKLVLPTKKIVDSLIKTYFDLTALKNGKRSRRIEIRFRRLSVNRIFVSKSDIKHSNNKVIVTIYTYNREKKIIFSKINKLYSTSALNSVSKLYNKHSLSSVNNMLTKKTYRKTPKKQRPKNVFIKKTRFAILNSIVVMKKVRKIRNLLVKSLDWKKENFKYYEMNYYKNFLKKLYKKQIINLVYEKNLYSSKNKYSNWFLMGIKSLLSNIYKKRVELNIINLKYLHYNSDNFINAVSTKLRNRNNRLKKVLRKAIQLVKVPRISSPYLPIDFNLKSGEFFYSWLKKQDKTKLEGPHFMSSTDTIKEFDDKKLVNRSILNSILKATSYKIVNGVRLEAAGRLSKRLTASKSVFKYKHKGSLKDIDSSYKGFSSNISKGYSKPNLEQTSLSSKTRNGAFGLKGYLSGYTGTRKTTFSSPPVHTFLNKRKY